MQVEAQEAMREALHLKLRGVGLWLASLRGVAPRVQKEALTTILLCADELTFQSEQRAALSLNPPLSLDAGEEPVAWIGQYEWTVLTEKKFGAMVYPDRTTPEQYARPLYTRPQPSIDKPAEPSAWISVDERLPPAMERLLFYDLNRGHPVRCYGYKATDDVDSPQWMDVVNTDRDGEPTDSYEVTHWMPLPAPPAASRDRTAQGPQSCPPSTVQDEQEGLRACATCGSPVEPGSGR